MKWAPTGMAALVPPISGPGLSSHRENFQGSQNHDGIIDGSAPLGGNIGTGLRITVVRQIAHQRTKLHPPEAVEDTSPEPERRKALTPSSTQMGSGGLPLLLHSDTPRTLHQGLAICIQLLLPLLLDDDDLRKGQKACCQGTNPLQNTH